MRLNLNLATHPYRDVRQFLMTWGIAAAALAVITVALSVYAIYAWRQSRSTREQISQVRSEIYKLDRERAAGVALLNQPQNRDIASQASFLNSLIARRSFSLTRLFMELERMMPPRLHVVSIAPSLNKHNQIEIHMLVGGDSRDQAEELVKRLEDSPSFRQPELRAESFGVLSGGDRVQFDIASIYVTQAGAAEPAKEEAADKEKAPEKGKASAGAAEAKAVPAKDKAPSATAAGAPRPASAPGSAPAKPAKGLPGRAAAKAEGGNSK
jgi:type IV pilus assembly protein PilN